MCVVGEEVEVFQTHQMMSVEGPPICRTVAEERAEGFYVHEDHLIKVTLGWVVRKVTADVEGDGLGKVWCLFGGGGAVRPVVEGAVLVKEVGIR